MTEWSWITCPRSQDKTSRPKLQLWPLQYPASCYLMYFFIGLSHHMKELWLVTMILLLGQLLDRLQRFFFVLSDCLGTVLFLGGQLWWPKALLKLRYFFKVLSWWTLFPSGYELCLLFGNKKDTHPVRIIVIPCIGKRSKVLETGKQEVSAPLTVDLLCFTCVCCLFALRWESVRVSLRNFFMCSNSFLILKNEGT